MTDPTDPIDPADRAWFRSHIDPVLDAEPIADAWDEVAARVRGGSAPPSAAPSRPRWIAAAAILVALALAGLAVVATQGDDDRDTLRSGGDHPAGWYVPTGLPEGWRLQSAMATEAPPCDGASVRWKTLPEHAEDDGSRPAIELHFSSCEPLPDDPGPAGPALGPDAVPSFVGVAAEDPSWEVVRWEDDGLWELTGEGISGARLLEAADAVASDPAADAPPLPELGNTGAGSGQQPRPGGSPGAALVLVSPAGERVQYELVASGEGPQLTPFTNEVAHPVAAQPLPLRRRGSIALDRLPGVGAMGTGYLFGTWPGADVFVPEHVQPAPGTDRQPTAVEARAATDALAGSLRPASTKEWRTFLATAAEPVTDQALLTATSLATIGAEPATTPSVSGPDRATSTTTEPPDAGEAVSAPASVTPTEPSDGEPRGQYSDLTGLRVRLRLTSTVVGVSRPTAGALLIENTTDDTIAINECSSLLTRWGLLPRGERGMLPRRTIIDCFDTPTTTIEAGKETIVPLDWDTFPGFVARNPGHGPASPYLGTLPAGEYTAVAIIPGSTGDIRVEVPVTVLPPPCPMTDEEATAYRGLSTSEATDAAAGDGREVVVASEDGTSAGITWNLDCERVQAHVLGGQVIDYTFG